MWKPSGWVEFTGVASGVLVMVSLGASTVSLPEPLADEPLLGVAVAVLFREMGRASGGEGVKFSEAPAPLTKKRMESVRGRPLIVPALDVQFSTLESGSGS